MESNLCWGGASGAGKYTIRFSSQSNYAWDDQANAKLNEKEYIMQAVGEATSFGSYISTASGEPLSNRVMNLIGGSRAYSRGFNGYNGIVEYNSNDVIGDSSNSYIGIALTGIGYGAGGGSVFHNDSQEWATYIASYTYTDSSGSTRRSARYTITTMQAGHHPGACGDIKITVVDLTEGDSIACSVGKGGKIVSINDHFKKLCDDCYASHTSNHNEAVAKSGYKFTSHEVDILSYYTSGRDGVIILQYLGG